MYKESGIVKGRAFNSWRRVGALLQAIRVYNMREVDELVFLDISATLEQRSPDFELVDEFADECFMPLTVGGGIKSTEDVRRLFEVGADKISINTAAVVQPSLVEAIANKFGSQCVVISIDVKKRANGQYEVFTHAGERATGLDPVIFAKEMSNLGAGEILLTSIKHDGTMTGYDIEITRKVSEAVTIPVVASGGAGNYEHMLNALLEGKASAVAAASMFHFTQQTPLEAKQYLRKHGVPVRL